MQIMKKSPQTLITAIIIAALAAAGCTRIAHVPPSASAPDRAAAPEASVPLRLCLLKDKGVSCEQADRIVTAITREMARSGVAVTVPWIRDWQRPGFSSDPITRAIAAYPLEAPCDRILALVGRNLKDFAWGLVLPEILGWVETLTRTKGYAVAETGSLNQLLTFQSPAAGAVHEVYHMLGCVHDDTGEACADNIARLKDLAVANRSGGRDLFPGLDAAGRPLATREGVEAQFDEVLSRPANAYLAARAAPQPSVCALN